jgi:lysophospholipase L1-like esterase
MLLRRALAVLTLAACAALTGCDDGPAPTSAAPSGPTTPAQELPYPTYVALGDSYTAAPGVPHTEQESGCFRSTGNYPNLVGHQLRSDLVDVSCSGATTLSLVGAQQAAGHVEPPQFAALSADTSLVTLSIGGNDLQLFQTMVGTCGQLGLGDPAGSPCRDQMSAGGKDLLAAKIAKIGARVTSALEGIHDRSPQARVVLVGYPQTVPARSTCPILPLATGDYPYVRRVLAGLNDAMRVAARTAHADFVDLAEASKGHDICAGEDAWVNGKDTNLTRALAFHPFAEEQQAVADLILAKLDVG